MAELVPCALRKELKVAKLVQQGVTSFVVKEPDKQAYYHFDDAQYAFICMFDGTKSLSQLIQKYNQNSELYEFEYDDAFILYQSCKEFGLLVRNKAEKNAALLEKIKEERAKKILQGQGSLLFLRFQLVDPNAFFNRIIDHIRFIWHPNAIKFQLIFLLCALVAVLFQGERFVNDFNRVYLQAQQGSLGILSIWLIALAAIAIHECGHGLTCKYYGGDVHEMGFLLLAFQPCLYCNVNDAWLFENKWQKIYVALAGVWVELLLAGISAFIWLVVDVANMIGFIAFVLLTIGIATTVMVNLNPLLKFDGYYILTDLLEIKNLRQNSIAWMSYTLKSRVLGLAEEAPFTPSKREKKVYLIYGILVTLYMVFILSFIALIGYEFISAKFGFIANCAFIYLIWFVVKKITGTWSETLVKWFKITFWQTKKRKKLTALLSLGVFVLMVFWQPHMRVSATGVVAAPTHVIYAPQSGFVKSANYQTNRMVNLADKNTFIVLDSADLAMQKLQLETDESALYLQQQEALSLSDSSLMSQLLIKQALVDEKRLALDSQLKSLNIVIPKGLWLVDDMPKQMLVGRYFHQGDPIVTLVDAHDRYIDVIVDQRDFALLKLGNDARIQFSGSDSKIFSAQVIAMSPLAKLDGIEQSVMVRMQITPQQQVPVLGLSADVLIFAEKQALWRHFIHLIRKILRADLWL